MSNFWGIIRVTDGNLHRPPPPKKNKKGKGRLSESTESPPQSQEEPPSSEASESQFTEVESEVEDPEAPPTPYADPHMLSYASAPAVLYRHDSDLNQFIKERPVYAQIVRRDDSPPFHYWLMAANGEQIYLFHLITSEMNQNVARNSMSITWNHIGDGVGRSWCLQFQTEPEFNSVVEALTIALWEHGNQYSWSKLKVRNIITSGIDIY